MATMSKVKNEVKRKTTVRKTGSIHAKSLDEVVKLVNEFKKAGKKVVLTQGVYDLIHEGHARYLEMARSYGDVLVVGVDSDALTKQRKGPKRPIVPEGERVEMLMHLRHVDVVVVREVEHHIDDLIFQTQPDVLVTSLSTKDFNDSKKMKKKYKDYVGTVVTLPPQAITSTTARIRLLTIDGAEQLADQINVLIKDFISKIRNS